MTSNKGQRLFARRGDQNVQTLIVAQTSPTWPPLDDWECKEIPGKLCILAATNGCLHPNLPASGFSGLLNYPHEFQLEDSEMDAQLQRSAIAVCSGSADLGEILAAAGRVIPGDYDCWYSEWGALAEKTAQLADNSLRGGHRLSAAKAFLRATEYWRQAIFFIRHDLQEPRLLKGWRALRESFRAPLPLLPWCTTMAALPFEGGWMNAYLLRPDGSDAQRPTILAPCGFDSTAEASYAASGYMAQMHPASPQ